MLQAARLIAHFLSTQPQHGAAGWEHGPVRRVTNYIFHGGRFKRREHGQVERDRGVIYVITREDAEKRTVPRTCSPMRANLTSAVIQNRLRPRARQQAVSIERDNSLAQSFPSIYDTLRALCREIRNVAILEMSLFASWNSTKREQSLCVTTHRRTGLVMEVRTRE